jgi:tRNA pseudouridine38/39 synthase
MQVVDSLQYITKAPKKPQYIMAPQLLLILLFCLFDKVCFVCSAGMYINIFPLNNTSE